MTCDIDFLTRKLSVKKRGNTYYLSIPSSIIKELRIKDGVSEVGVVIHQIHKDGKTINLCHVTAER